MIRINVKEALKAAVSYSDSSQSKIAGADKSVLGYSKQNFSNKINSGRLSLNEFMRAMEELGVELVIKNILDVNALISKFREVKDKKEKENKRGIKFSCSEIESIVSDFERNDSLTTRLKDASEKWKIRAQDFFDLLDFLGMDYELVQPEGNFNVEKYIEGEGERIRYLNTGSKKWYDTKCSHAISNSFYEDGKNRYDENGEATELYRTKDGEYFVAKYYESDDVQNVVEVIREKEVAEYISKHGAVKRKPQ